MSLVGKAVQRAFPRKRDAEPAALQNSTGQTLTLSELVDHISLPTLSGERVSATTVRSIASWYRGVNILGDDVASMPLQTFLSRQPGQIDRLPPDFLRRNIAYLLEQQPNRYQTPQQFLKMYVEWLVHNGNAYFWAPPRREREIFVLRADRTFPQFDVDGNRWFHTTFADGSSADLPDVEVLHLMLNPDEWGFIGRGVLQFARERAGLQLGAYRTQSKFFKSGLNMSGVVQMAGDLNPDARKKVKDEFIQQTGGADNAYGVAVIDAKMLQFTPITMKGTDMQFLESIQATDVDIANFLGMPLYKLNAGKEAYNSNEQQDLNYLKTTLNPYLVGLEMGARQKWVSAAEQAYTYFRFERSALLRTDAKSRGDYLNAAINNGRMTPNEARQVEDMPAFTGGDDHYMPANIVSIEHGPQPAGGTNA